MPPLELFLKIIYIYIYIFLMGPIRDDTHASYASASYHQLMVIHMLLMHVFCIYLLFVQVFFIFFVVYIGALSSRACGALHLLFWSSA